MAEDATFSTFGNANAADALADVISKIKSDMAAIEASAKNIENSLTKASRQKIGGGSSFGAQNAGGATGSAKSAFGASSLGQITSQLGGARGILTTGGFAGGAMAGGMGGFGGAGAVAGGLAVAGLPDILMGPEEALHRERARFGMAQATGSFATFQNMLNVAKNDFNVQDMNAFRNTMVYGVQRAGMVGLNGGGTIGERRAAAQIGGFNTLAGLAGIEQSAVPGMMQASLSAQNYYASMAAGIMTRNPVTGETIGIEGQVNQAWAGAGLRGTKQEMLDQIGINYAEGSTGIQQLREQFGGNEDMVQMYIEGLRLRASQGGKALKENQLQDQAKAAGILGTKYTQADEGVRKVESSREGFGAEYLDDATAGIEEATKHISNAIDLLTNLEEGPLKDLIAGFQTAKTQMDVFNTELPNATKGITDFLGGLPGLLLGYLMGGGGKGSLLSRGGSLLGRGLLTRALPLMANPWVLGAAAVAGVTYLGYKYGENPEDVVSQGHMSNYTTGGMSTTSAGGSGQRAGGTTAQQDTRSGARTQTTGYGHSKGDWFVESDQDTRIHYGEMVLPNRIATAVRQELAVGKTSSAPAPRGRDGSTVNIYLTIQRATDQEAMNFASKVKRIIEDDTELLAIGAGRLSRGYDR